MEDGNSVLKVEIEHLGLYTFVTDKNDHVLFFNSPLSGIYKYYFEEENDRFVSTRDGHLLLENLTREICSNCKGFLNF